VASLALEGAALFGLRFVVHDQLRWGLFGGCPRNASVPGWSLDAAAGAVAGMLEGGALAMAAAAKSSNGSRSSSSSSSSSSAMTGASVADRSVAALRGLAAATAPRHAVAIVAQRGAAVSAAMGAYTLSLEALGLDADLEPGSPRTGNARDVPWVARVAAGAVAGAAAAAVASVANFEAVAAAPGAVSAAALPKAAGRLWPLRAALRVWGPAGVASAGAWAVACGLHGAVQPAFERARVGMASAAERRRLRSQLHDLGQ
jgi:hypothetical protein